MRKKIKTFLKAVKNFIVVIDYKTMLKLIIELSILSAIFINILLMMFEVNSYFDLVKYSLAIITLFAVSYAIEKKNTE